MQDCRISKQDDIPRLKELWALSFGDEGAYVDNFFQRYYRPERMLVLEQAGSIQAMTAWFDTELVRPDGECRRAAYLYAVATHPDARNKGLAGRILRDADVYFQTIGCDAVTTVPAEPSLHQFFARHGFREYFTHQEKRYSKTKKQIAPLFSIDPIDPAGYQAQREQYLKGIPHIALPEDAIFYQQGICALKEGGGLYQAKASFGSALLCAEEMGNGTLLMKEILGEPSTVEQLLQELPIHLKQWSGLYRIPGDQIPFGMLKWINGRGEYGFSWDQNGYLGLAFD